MKKHLFILLFILTSASLDAQETSLTLEVVPGKLASQLTKEQMSSVKELTLTGEMYNCDFYVIRDSMPELKMLNLKNVMADTIPDRAFYRKDMKNIILPICLEYIGNFAFEYSFDTEIVFTGRFPQIGTHILFNGNALKTSEDNIYCKEIAGCICSNDNLTLYLAPFYGGKVPDGIEIISEKAFEGHCCAYIELPASVKYIKFQAFANIQMDLPTGNYDRYHNGEFVCFNPIPPEVENNVFDNSNFPCLFVPAGSVATYKADANWSIFDIYP